MSVSGYQNGNQSQNLPSRILNQQNVLALSNRTVESPSNKFSQNNTSRENFYSSLSNQKNRNMSDFPSQKLSNREIIPEQQNRNNSATQKNTNTPGVGFNQNISNGNSSPTNKNFNNLNAIALGSSINVPTISENQNNSDNQLNKEKINVPTIAENQHSKTTTLLSDYMRNTSGTIQQCPITKNNINRTVIGAYGVKQEGGEIEPMVISRRSLRSGDVEIDLQYCGICHSDIHHTYNEWKDSIYPMVPGHEMTGVVSNIGHNVKKFNIGDRVAVGNLVNSCKNCNSCNGGDEQYCENGGPSWVYNGHERNEGELLPAGELTFGGYSQMIVVNEDFVVRIPDKLDLAESTPLLCAGITVFTPLIQNKVGPGTVVGVAGIGGLGHLAIKFAKAMGATVVAITKSQWKIDDCSRLGADKVIFASDDYQMRINQSTMDIILDTIPFPHKQDLYIKLLKPYGVHWILGTLEKIKPFNAKNLIYANKSIGASTVGGIASTQDMLNFCADHNITSDIEYTTLDNVRDCFDRVRAADVKYRFVIDLKQSKFL